MGLRELFGSSEREAAWRELSDRLTVTNVQGHCMWGGQTVQAHVKDWIITLDTFVENEHNHTRLRAPFVNSDGFRFTLERAGLFSGLLTRYIGMQDIEVGVPEFDRDFVIKVSEPIASNAKAVQALLANERIRSLIAASPPFLRLAVKGDERFNQRSPEGIDELHLQVQGLIRELERLESLFDLFGEILMHMCHLSKAYEDAVELVMRLARPGGRITERETVMWDGDKPRREAVDALGRLKDPKAVPALIAALDDDDPVLRVKALDALKEIGDVRAVPGLIAHLGCAEDIDGFPFRNRIISLLQVFGEEKVVDAFNQALYGSAAGVEQLRQDGRRAVIDGLLCALEAREPKSWQAYARNSTVVHAAEALAELGAVEALPKLRANTHILQSKDAALKVAWQSAIAKLEALELLPRPAGEVVQVDTLPRTASGSSAPTTETLPRTSGKQV